MKRNYCKPSITVLPMQIVGPNMGSGRDNAALQGDNYREGMVWDEDTQSWVWP